MKIYLKYIVYTYTPKWNFNPTLYLKLRYISTIKLLFLTIDYTVKVSLANNNTLFYYASLIYAKNHETFELKI